MLGLQNPLPSRERLGSASVGGRLSCSSAKKRVWASWSLSIPGNWLAHLTFPCAGSSSHHPQKGLLGALPDSLPRGRADALLSRWANTSERLIHLFKVTQQVGPVTSSSCLASHSTCFPSNPRPSSSDRSSWGGSRGGHNLGEVPSPRPALWWINLVCHPGRHRELGPK